MAAHQNLHPDLTCIMSYTPERRFGGYPGSRQLGKQNFFETISLKPDASAFFACTLFFCWCSTRTAAVVTMFLFLQSFVLVWLERIILGGGLLQADHLYTKVAAAFDTLMGDYLPVSGAELITAPGLGEHVGVLGGAVLALEAFS